MPTATILAVAGLRTPALAPEWPIVARIPQVREIIGGLDMLPARVQHVETSSAQISTVRDRTNMGSLFEIDAGSAHYVYYPGRIFEVAQGRFIVIQQSNEQGSVQSTKGETRQVSAEGDVYVEPFLNDDSSSPRRRVYVDILSNADGDAGFEAEPTLIGEFPLGVGLCQVRCTVDHVATYRLDPDSSEVRQRIFHASQTAAQRDASALVTTALAIYSESGDGRNVVG